MPSTTSAFDLEIQKADGSWLGLMLKRPVGRDGRPIEGAPIGLAEALVARTHGSEMVDPLVPVTQETWIRGLGLDYVEAAGVYTRTPGVALPAGEATVSVLPAGNMGTAIVAFAEYGTDLFCAEEGNTTTGGRVFRLPGGVGTFWALSNPLPPGEIIRDLCVFDDGAGTLMLYCSASDVTGANGKLYRWNGSVWSAAASFAPKGRGRMKRVFWRDAEGVGAPRLVTITGQNTIAYTIPEADPMLAASWVEDVRVLSESAIDDLAAARNHIWISSKTDLHDLTELGDTPGLMGYDNRAPHGIRFPVQYFEGYVYRAAANTLDRIKVEGDPSLQENPGNCAPGWGTEAENEWRGYPTALTVDQGYLVAALWNPSTGKTGIFWGKDRNTLGVETPNPLVWYGPEVTSNVYRRVTAMEPSMQDGTRKLWIASLTPTGNEVVSVSLPVAGAPLQDLLVAGAHRFAVGQANPYAAPVAGKAWQTVCRLQLMPDTFEDKVAKKIVYGLGTGSRGLDPSIGTRLLLEVRADPDPAQIDWDVLEEVDGGPSREIVSSTVVEGYNLQRRYHFYSPEGDAIAPKPAILDGARLTVWKVVPDFGLRVVEVEYGQGVLDRHNVSDDQRARNPEQVTYELVTLTRLARTVVRDSLDRRFGCRLRQVVDRSETYTEQGPWGKRVTARIELVMLSAEP